ncbi:hypothetical protein HD806DRAFT_423298 [Xylariaceae sp. AK1471]|nr:hypothetical protein HD806DRAFT_423298 [Xylariaceae sp. AK1471]
MDPVTVISLAASAGSLISQILKAKSVLGDLHEKFKTAQLAISSLTTQLSALEASTAELEAILRDREASLQPRESLLTALSQSLSSCGDVIQYLLGQVTEVTGAAPVRAGLSRWSRAKFALNESDLAPMKEALRDQVQAIQLLLSVALLRREDEQETVLNDADSVRVLETAANRSSSLLWLRDRDSILSLSSLQSDTLSRLSMIFKFDGELLGSEPYRKAVMKTWKGLRAQRKATSSTLPPIVLRDDHVSMTLVGRPFTNISYVLGRIHPMVSLIASWDFSSERADELDCQAGQVLMPVAMTDGDEWVVAKPVDRLSGPGLVPISYMTLISRTGDRHTSQDEILRELRAIGIVSVKIRRSYEIEY